MRLTIAALVVVLAGCAQPKVAQSKPGKISDELEINLRLARIESALGAMMAQKQVADQDRAEIIAFNECQAYCETTYPWPYKPEDVTYEVWSSVFSVKKAQANRQKCNSECNKRKPKAQPDWSC